MESKVEQKNLEPDSHLLGIACAKAGDQEHANQTLTLTFNSSAFAYINLMPIDARLGILKDNPAFARLLSNITPNS